jgi:hypothetical protein
MSKVKTFDAVAFQRQARERISRELNENPEKFYRELREQFGHLHKKQTATRDA